MPNYPSINIEQHQVDTLLITCSDYRFQPCFEYLQKSLGIDKADSLAYPGPSKAIAGKTLLPAILDLYKLHGFNVIHILDHTDCGKFGGLKQFGGDETKEAIEHFRILRLAEKELRKALPEVTVVSHVLGSKNEIRYSEAHLIPGHSHQE